MYLSSTRTLTSHDDTGHIFVAARHDDHAVEPVSSCCSFDLVRDEVPGLEGIVHCGCPIAQSVTHAYRTELVPDHASLTHGRLDFLPKT